MQEEVKQPLPTLQRHKSLTDLCSLVSQENSSFGTSSFSSESTSSPQHQETPDNVSIDDIKFDSDSSIIETNLILIKEKLIKLIHDEAALRVYLQKTPNSANSDQYKAQLLSLQEERKQFEPILIRICRKYHEQKSPLTYDEMDLLQIKERMMLFGQSTKICPEVAASFIKEGVQRFFANIPADPDKIEFNKRLVLIKIGIDSSNIKQWDSAFNLDTNHNNSSLRARLFHESMLYCLKTNRTSLLKNIIIENLPLLNNELRVNLIQHKSKPYFLKIALILCDEQAKTALTPLLEPLQAIYDIQNPCKSIKIVKNCFLSDIESQFLNYISSLQFLTDKTHMTLPSSKSLKELAQLCSDRIVDLFNQGSLDSDSPIYNNANQLNSIFQGIIDANTLLKPMRRPLA